VTRVYTRTGDDGSTGLIGGSRVSKASLRVEAYGTIDELNAIIGMVLSHPLPHAISDTLLRVQDDLFTIGANLALPEGTGGSSWGIPALQKEDVARMEGAIDRAAAALEPLRRFILPGGTAAGALLHLARTVARRAERRCVALAEAEKMDPAVLRYLNRLSDLCFVLARAVNHDAGCAEKHPAFGRFG